MDEFTEFLAEVATLCNSIENRAATVRTRIQHTVAQAEAYHDLLGTISLTVESWGRNGGKVNQIISELRLSGRRLSLLAHDLEAALSETYFLRRCGVDLATLLPREGVQVDRLNFEQSGPARLVFSNTQPYHAVAIDQIGIDLPIRISFASSTWDILLHATVAILCTGEAFHVRLARHPHVVTGDLPLGIINQIVNASVDRMRSLVTTSLGAPADVGFGIVRPRYFASSCDGLVRLYAECGITERSEFALQKDSFKGDLVMRMKSKLLTNIVQNLVIENGGSIVGGPHFSGGDGFNFVAERSLQTSAKVACVRFTAIVSARLQLRATCSVEANNTLIFDVTQSGEPNIDVKIRPYILPLIQNIAESLAEKQLKEFVPNIQFQQRYPFRLVRSILVRISATGIELELTMKPL